MGDLVNCSSCDVIFDFEYDGYQCDGCDHVFCRSCIESRKVVIFTFGGAIRCTECFKPYPRAVCDIHLLYFLLDRYKLSRKQVLEEFLEIAPHYTVPQDSYTCTECEPHTCASKECLCVSEDYEDPPTDIRYRGYCCKAQGITMCLGCKRWEAKRTSLIMIGIRKFRKGNILRGVPRDVLKHCILIPLFSMLSKDQPRKGEEKKKLKRGV